jgi:hypothetical protein
MTDQELEIVTKWQESPPGKAFDRIRSLGIAITELSDLMLHRESVGEMSQRNAINALIDHRHELDCLIDDAVRLWKLKQSSAE